MQWQDMFCVPENLQCFQYTITSYLPNLPAQHILPATVFINLCRLHIGIIGVNKLTQPHRLKCYLNQMFYLLPAASFSFP